MSVLRLKFERLFVHFLSRFSADFVTWISRVFDFLDLFGTFEFDEQDNRINLMSMKSLQRSDRYIENTVRIFRANILDGLYGSALKVASLLSVIDIQRIAQTLLERRL